MRLHITDFHAPGRLRRQQQRVKMRSDTDLVTGQLITPPMFPLHPGRGEAFGQFCLMSGLSVNFSIEQSEDR